jgi:protein-L-isoaspartate(D-aspartate) O-methyltransferase
VTAHTWRQVDIVTKEKTGFRVLATDVAPELDRAVRLGVLTGWWYTRKASWRLRTRTDDAGNAVIANLLDKLLADGRILDWHRAIYEPETLAFGGPDGMDCAHRLFHTDSHHLLARVRTAQHGRPPGRRETTAILCGVLLRAAGLDRYEQGDVWAKVSDERPIELADPVLLDERRRGTLITAMHCLLAVNPARLTTRDGPLAGEQEWVNAFDGAGWELRALADSGSLRRGLRAVLAHHIIFHANRAGLSVPDLSTMAALATAGTFGVDAVVSRRADVTTDH